MTCTDLVLHATSLKVQYKYRAEDRVLDTHARIFRSKTAPNDFYLWMQDLRQHFIPGVLSEEELGNKLYVHVLTQEYVARVNNPRAYDAISRDILQRWCFPFVPDCNLLPLQGSQGPSTYSYQRHHRYRWATLQTVHCCVKRLAHRNLDYSYHIQSRELPLLEMHEGPTTHRRSLSHILVYLY